MVWTWVLKFLVQQDNNYNKSDAITIGKIGQKLMSITQVDQSLRQSILRD